MKRVKVGIVGAAGYTGAEVLRILLQHPYVDLVFVQSNSQAGKAVHQVHHDMLGDSDLIFCAEPLPNTDVLFLCMPHGKAKTAQMQTWFKTAKHIIDLSSDFRLQENASEFVYGLSEVFSQEIKTARHIANPGCFATAIQLALLPLAPSIIAGSQVIIHGTTGSTGGGKALSDTSHHPHRAGNLSVYKAFVHQHLKEIKQSLKRACPEVDLQLQFIPQRGNFTRGIFCTVLLNSSYDLNAIRQAYTAAYAASPFVFYSCESVYLKQVVNTNKCVITAEQFEGNTLVTVVLDNLLKGAAGQAIQNMNLLIGIPEATGLKLKASVY